jgi:sugar phosphate isomerase/epimerase
MKTGTTSFAYRYLFLDPARAPSLEAVVENAARSGIRVLQICENARPMEMRDEAWERLLRAATGLGVEIQLGCKTVDLDVFRAYAVRAAELPSKLLRVVLEWEEGPAPTRGAVNAFLAGVWPVLEETGLKLAIENHFDISSEVLAEAVEGYPAERVGFCVDTANSLRNFETPERVMELLGGRALCYHLKDYRVDGDKLGFKVSGAKLGEGRLDLDGTLEWIFAKGNDPLLLVENWTPGSGDWEKDVREDDIWLRASYGKLLERLTAPR